MFLFLLLLPILTRAEERSPPSTYMHSAAFQHRGTLWIADGVLHVRVPLELTFLEEECRSTKTLLQSAVVKTTGKWQQVVLQRANRTLYDACLEIRQWEHLLPRRGTRTDSTVTALLASPGVIETQARHITDFNTALVDLVAHHRLVPPLLTPSVVQDVWEMYQEETGKAAFPFGPEMVNEAAASYVVTEKTLYAVLHSRS